MTDTTKTAEERARENLLLGEFEPCVVEHEELGLTIYMHENVAYRAVAVGPHKEHHVDALLAEDDDRLVGVQFWWTLKRIEEAEQRGYERGLEDAAKYLEFNTVWVCPEEIRNLKPTT